MRWKKNAFSYLSWVIYAVAVEVGMVCLADAICDAKGVKIYFGTIACVLYMVLAGIGVFLCIARWNGGRDLWQRKMSWRRR